MYHSGVEEEQNAYSGFLKSNYAQGLLCMNASTPSATYMNWISIGLGNGLLPVRRQAIT